MIEFNARNRTLENSAVVTEPVAAPPLENLPVSDLLEIVESVLQTGNGNCFIATAAYGSFLAPEVELLREFRDRFMLTNAPGRAFVSFYYEYSPPLANFIGQHDSLRAAVRVVLTPVVYSIKYPLAATLVLILIISSLGYRRGRLLK